MNEPNQVLALEILERRVLSLRLVTLASLDYRVYDQTSSVGTHKEKTRCVVHINVNLSYLL